MINIPKWESRAVVGVIKQIERSMKNNNGRLLDCWKHYLKTMNKNSLEIMKELDKSFMKNVLDLL